MGSYSACVVVYAWYVPCMFVGVLAHSPEADATCSATQDLGNTFPRPAMKCGTAIAFINTFSQLGNVSGAYIFPSAWGPTYKKSYGICILCFVLTIVGVLFHRWNLCSLNRKLDKQDDSGKQNVAEGLELPRRFRYVR